ncbi:MFS transporter [Haladaptatus caseinilyticus]|uniref:MFS transporter n=1 Tax=Haladaptatus caseinilyticus TaxID=2993314 RepID=UPI00224B3B9C|nr:MFS transporter [Haladaptatus caseinilyticus]
MTNERRADYLVIFVLWLLVFVVASQALIIAPILPRIADQLSAPEAVLGTLITSYAVAVGVFSLIVGPISDHVGRHRILLVGTALLTVSLAAHGLAWDFVSLLAVRGLAGIAGGVLNGAAVAYVGDYFPREQRGWANGWVFSGFAAGQIAGIPLGAILAERLGFRVPFLLFAVLMAVTFVLVWTVVPKPDVQLATGRLSFGSAIDAYATLLRRPEIAAATIVFIVMFMGNALYTTYLPTWLEATLGMSGTAIGAMFFVGGIANVLAGPQAGILSDRVGRKRVIVAASVGIAVVMFATPFLAIAAGVLAVYALFFVVMGLFASRATPFQTMLTELVSGDQRGSLMSLTVGIGQVGSGIGGALAGGAYVAVGYDGTTTIAAGAMVFIVVLVWRYLPETAHIDVPSGTERTEHLHADTATELSCGQTYDAFCGPTAEGGFSLEKTIAYEQARRNADGDVHPNPAEDVTGR